MPSSAFGDFLRGQSVSIYYKHGFGLFMLMIVVVLWVSSSVITQIIFINQQFSDPFFLTYFNTAIFITYLIPPLIRHALSNRASNTYRQVKITDLEKKAKFQVNSSPRDHEDEEEDEKSPSAVKLVEEQVEEAEQWTWKQIFRHSIVFCPVWFTMNFLFNYSLEKTSVATSTIMSSTSSMFTLVFSACLLKQRITISNGLGALFAIIGAVLVVLPDWNQTSQNRSLYGDIMALVSASIYAIYSTLLKYRLPDDSKLSMPIFFGLIGLTNVVTLAPIVLILHLTNVESLSGLTLQVFASLLVNAIVSMLSDLLWAKSVLFTSPLIASIALSLTIPLAEIADVIFNKQRLAPEYIGGSAFVFAGFVLANLQFSREQKEEIERIQRESEHSQ